MTRNDDSFVNRSTSDGPVGLDSSSMNVSSRERPQDRADTEAEMPPARRRPGDETTDRTIDGETPTSSDGTPRPEGSERSTFISRRPQKRPRADLKAQYRSTLLFGLALALGVVTGLFSTNLFPDDEEGSVFVKQQEIVDMQQITQTQQEAAPPPPRRPSAPVEVPNDVVIEDQPINLDASLDLNASLEVSGPPSAPEPERAEEESAPPEEEVFIAVEVKPELIGGQSAIYDEIQYPPAARQAGVEGRVIVQFIVDEDGNVTEPRVLKSPHSMLSQEALRVIQLVKFTPGRQRSQAVKVQMAMPIVFRLTSTDSR
jgi:protein TonB